MTDDKLTELYNAANGLDPNRHNPITTERIFAAMRAAMEVERSACRLAVMEVHAEAHEAAKAKDATTYEAGYQDAAIDCDEAIRMRSN